MALATALRIARRGYFIPYRYAGAMPDDRPPYAAIEGLIARCEDAFAALLKQIGGFATDLRAIGGEPAPAPRWYQDWFARLDACCAYTLVRTRAPARIVEVGSGHSTRFLARAIADGGLDCRITAIDPIPRAVLDGLDCVDLLRTPVHEAGLAPFEGLGAGDVLFIDSSHVLMPGTDVDLLFNRVLPILPAGALVHVHDVFLPDGYPADWAWRGYNEQLAVAPLLTGGGYAPVFASHYVRTRMADALAASIVAELPLLPGVEDGSLWLEKG